MADHKDRTSFPREADRNREIGAPASIDFHKLGEPDNPEADWGEATGEGAVFSSNHTRRGEPTEAMRRQGAKTRTANKDIVSRRG